MIVKFIFFCFQLGWFMLEILFITILVLFIFSFVLLQGLLLSQYSATGTWYWVYFLNKIFIRKITDFIDPTYLIFKAYNYLLDSLVYSCFRKLRVDNKFYTIFFQILHFDYMKYIADIVFLCFCSFKMYYKFFEAFLARRYAFHNFQIWTYFNMFSNETIFPYEKLI